MAYHTHEFSTDSRHNHQHDNEKKALDLLDKIHSTFRASAEADLILSKLEPKDYGWDARLHDSIERFIAHSIDYIPGDRNERIVIAATMAQML